MTLSKNWFLTYTPKPGHYRSFRPEHTFADWERDTRSTPARDLDEELSPVDVIVAGDES